AGPDPSSSDPLKNLDSGEVLQSFRNDDTGYSFFLCALCALCARRKYSWGAPEGPRYPFMG
ncbi:MAG: hypothetical protein V3R68_02950, partial [Gammaproteobacteria bacterium]